MDEQAHSSPALQQRRVLDAEQAQTTPWASYRDVSHRVWARRNLGPDAYQLRCPARGYRYIIGPGEFEIHDPQSGWTWRATAEQFDAKYRLADVVAEVTRPRLADRSER